MDIRGSRDIPMDGENSCRFFRGAGSTPRGADRQPAELPEGQPRPVQPGGKMSRHSRAANRGPSPGAALAKPGPGCLVGGSSNGHRSLESLRGLGKTPSLRTDKFGGVVILEKTTALSTAADTVAGAARSFLEADRPDSAEAPLLARTRMLAALRSAALCVISSARVARPGRDGLLGRAAQPTHPPRTGPRHRRRARSAWSRPRPMPRTLAGEATAVDRCGSAPRRRGPRRSAARRKGPLPGLPVAASSG